MYRLGLGPGLVGGAERTERDRLSSVQGFNEDVHHFNSITYARTVRIAEDIGSVKYSLVILMGIFMNNYKYRICPFPPLIHNSSENNDCVYRVSPDLLSHFRYHRYWWTFMGSKSLKKRIKLCISLNRMACQEDNPCLLYKERTLMLVHGLTMRYPFNDYDSRSMQGSSYKCGWQKVHAPFKRKYRMGNTFYDLAFICKYFRDILLLKNNKIVVRI